MKSNDRIVLRKAQAGDARAIGEAELDCFPDPWPGNFFSAEMFAPARYNQVAIDSSGRLHAYLFAAWHYLDLHILKVATLLHARRQGLARRLMRAAERHAVELGGESVTLEVRYSNRTAVELYQSLNYDLSGRRPSYYRDGEDALIMSRRIGDML
ncbi:MAG: GNAT family N-acetyltransferase [bacterium]|nr:GNAT family N-acetyltransferase [bacterium]